VGQLALPEELRLGPSACGRAGAARGEAGMVARPGHLGEGWEWGAAGLLHFSESQR